MSNLSVQACISMSLAIVSVVYRSYIHVLRTIYNYGLPTVHSTHLVRTCYRVVPVDIACLLVLRGALLLLPLLLHVCNLSYEEETISAWCQKFSYPVRLVVIMPKKDTRAASPGHGTSDSSTSSSAGQASQSSSEVDLGNLLHFLQSNQQAHEQSVAQQTAATTLLLQNLSQTVSSLVNTTRPTSASQPVSFPKLNKLEDSDDADAWFSMVERVLAGHGIVESRFALAVAPQLTGKARVAYNSLPLTDSMDYRKVKEAVLRRFQISAETYHERFRAVQLVDSESYLDLVARLNDLFTKWMDRVQASTVADVCDVLVREQLILSLSPEARMFVLEHGTVSATDTAKLVDTFVRAQRTASVQPDASISGQLASSPLVAAVNKYWSKHTSSSNSSKSTPVSQPCFFCAGEAHPRSQCPAKDEDCGKCGKRGHNTRACRSAGQTTRVFQVPGRQQDSVNISDNSFFLSTSMQKPPGGR